MAQRRTITPRLKAILQLASVGSTAVGSAAELSCSRSTIRNSLNEARKILGARNTTHAVAKALREGIIT